MATITIRGLDEKLKGRLRVQAARNGHSMEEEARELLRTALSSNRRQPANLAEAIRARFRPLGGVALPDTPREPMRQPPSFK